MFRRRLQVMSFGPMMVEDHEPDSLLKVNQYLFVGRLGHGAHANVYLALDTLTNSRFAAKAIRNPNPASLDREIRNMRRVSHPNIVKLLEVLRRRDKNTVYLIMEYAPGSLKGHILSERDAAAVFAQVVDGLAHLHSHGVVHQDIKPANILLSESGDVKIADFGIGHSFESADTIIGTPAYQAPEFLDEQPVRSPIKEDVWSLGVTLFECLFGRLPFKGETVYEIARASSSGRLEIPEAASPEVIDLLRKMLRTDPHERITLTEVRAHPWFQGAGWKVKIPVAPPKMKRSAEIEAVTAEVCGDDYTFVDKQTRSASWSQAQNFAHIV
jgi:serine/threonine-protein kinase 11